MKCSHLNRPIILCFLDYYLPGYRSGGPVRSISNFVDHFGDEFDIRIVTRDRDALDQLPYSDVQVDAWNSVGRAQVFYASRRTMSLRGVVQLLRDTTHDLVYLNSFFSFRFTTLPLLCRRLGIAPRKPCIIAPRGEFSVGAISIKAWKKGFYLSASRLISLSEGLHWQASSALEANDIRCCLDSIAESIHIVSDLPPVMASEASNSIAPPTRKPGPLRVVFLSRICRMKNLDFLLKALSRISAPIHLNIYGPIEDPSYWQICQSLIAAIPSHVCVEYLGEALPADVPLLFAAADLFVLPTKGENFGHVILEALSAGTPVIISDQTPWRGDFNRGVEELSLDDMSAWSLRLDSWAEYTEDILLASRTAAMNAAHKLLGDPDLIKSTRSLFQQVLHSSDESFSCVE